MRRRARRSSLAPGVEYDLADAQLPHLYLIRKLYRESPSKEFPLAFYYILDGGF